MRDPYEVLGAERGTSAGELQKLYRKLAKSHHPDLNPGDKAAEDRFKEVTAAYDLLSDPDKRGRFDRGEIDASGTERPPRSYYRHDGPEAADDPYASDAGFADFASSEDAFAELLRRSQRARANRRGYDVQYRLPIDFAESITGADKRLTLPDGGTLDVTIPPGLVDGQVLRLKGKGEPGAGAGGPGDALIEVEVRPDPRFTRDGDTVSIEVPVSLAEAVLGGSIRVPTPTGQVMLTVPKGSNTGTTLRLKGKGAPRRGGGAGDELVRLKIVLPKGSDAELETFVSGWSKGRDHDPREGVAS